jgi:hypothetical protein
MLYFIAVSEFFGLRIRSLNPFTFINQFHI